MNLTFRQTADPRGLDVLRGDKRVASLQWHPDRAPRLVVEGAWESFTLAELTAITERLRTEIEAVGR